MGYDFFNDRKKFHAHCIETDILHLDPDLVALNGTADIIFDSRVLHQRDWDTQLAALHSIIALSKSGSVVVGFHAGWVDDGLIAYRKGPFTMGLHD